MGRSRKKTSEGQGGPQGSLKEKEMRRIIMLLAASSILIILAIIVLVSGELRRAGESDSFLQTAESSLDAEELEPDGGGEDMAGEDGIGKDGADGDGEGAGAEASAAEELVLEPDNKEYVYDFGTSILSQDTVPEVTQLMEQYFMSISDCDMATFLHLFTSRDTSQEEFYRQEFEQQKQYIEGYQNISCYTVPGLRDGEMVAYVYYEIRYTDVETPAPSLVRIYAVQGEDGQYRIYDQAMSEELIAYLDQLAVNEDVRLLSSQVDQKMEEAMAADAALRERVEFMKHGASYMQEEAGVPEEAGAAAEENAESADNTGSGDGPESSQ